MFAFAHTLIYKVAEHKKRGWGRIVRFKGVVPPPRTCRRIIWRAVQDVEQGSSQKETIDGYIVKNTDGFAL